MAPSCIHKVMHLLYAYMLLIHAPGDHFNPYPAEFTINRADIGGDLAWDPIIPLV